MLFWIVGKINLFYVYLIIIGVLLVLFWIFNVNEVLGVKLLVLIGISRRVILFVFVWSVFEILLLIFNYELII